MRVEVYLYAQLRQRGPDKQGLPLVVDLNEGATGEQLLTLLGISPGEAVLLVLDGERADPAAPLAEGMRVAIFPPLGGG